MLSNHKHTTIHHVGYRIFAEMNESEKAGRYERCLQQIEAITDGESDVIANLANIVAVLKNELGYFWIGFYIVRGNELVLGPFQGTPACVRIARGRGVCGTCWDTGTTQLVHDVHAFPGHIACDARSQSEIVVPVRNIDGDVVMVLDLDHDQPAAFSETDQRFLEELTRMMQPWV